MTTNNDHKLGTITQRVLNLETTKAGSEYVSSELNHIKEGLDEIKEKVNKRHSCTNIRLIENLEVQLRDNSMGIKKLYTWQATVGISLLVFFLTMGVAALRFVDSIDHSVETNTKVLNKMNDKLEIHDQKFKEQDILHIRAEAFNKKLNTTTEEILHYIKKQDKKNR